MAYVDLRIILGLAISRYTVSIWLWPNLDT